MQKSKPSNALYVYKTLTLKKRHLKSIKGTLTEKNLLTSFAGESQARMRYTYFAKEAKREGYEQIAAIFAETAEQEKMHAKRMLQFFEGGMVEICAAYPAGEIRTTMENLRSAVVGEFEEWHDRYPIFADVAEDEGFKDVAHIYRSIIIAEQAHERCPAYLHTKGYFEVKAENY